MYNTVKDLTPEQKQKLIILSYGPARAIPEDFGFRVRNYCSENDYLSRVISSSAFKIGCQIFSAIGGESKQAFVRIREELSLKGRTHINSLPCEKGGSIWLDHEFMSPTYQKRMIRDFEDLYLQHGVFNE